MNSLDAHLLFFLRYQKKSKTITNYVTVILWPIWLLGKFELQRHIQHNIFQSSLLTGFLALDIITQGARECDNWYIEKYNFYQHEWLKIKTIKFLIVKSRRKVKSAFSDTDLFVVSGACVFSVLSIARRYIILRYSEIVLFIFFRYKFYKYNNFTL